MGWLYSFRISSRDRSSAPDSSAEFMAPWCWCSSRRVAAAASVSPPWSPPLRRSAILSLSQRRRPDDENRSRPRWWEQSGGIDPAPYPPDPRSTAAASPRSGSGSRRHQTERPAFASQACTVRLCAYACVGYIPCQQAQSFITWSLSFSDSHAHAASCTWPQVGLLLETEENKLRGKEQKDSYSVKIGYIKLCRDLEYRLKKFSLPLNTLNNFPFIICHVQKSHLQAGRPCTVASSTSWFEPHSGVCMFSADTLPNSKTFFN